MSSVTQTNQPVWVHSVMQRHPITIHDTDTIQDAVDKMTENHVTALPVVDDGNYLKGILTVADLLRRVQDAERTLDSSLAVHDETGIVLELIRESLGTDEVINVMSANPITIEQGDSMQQVAKLMIQHQIHHVPVISKDMRLLGIVSTTDFVRLAAESI